MLCHGPDLDAYIIVAVAAAAVLRRRASSCLVASVMAAHVSQVIDLISLKPFDLEAITKSIKKTRKCIIVEECMKTGGIGASLSAVINESLFNELDHEVSVTRIAF